MLDQLLGGSRDSLVRTLSSQLGLNPDQAGGFLTKALAVIQSAIKSGKIDPAALLKGDPSALVSKLDLGSLSQMVGGQTGKAQTGVQTILAQIMSSAKSNPEASKLLSQLGGSGGGLVGALSGAASKMFGKG